MQVSIDDKGSYLYAAFGAPVTHEDDTERAVSAALDISRSQRRACPPGGGSVLEAARVVIMFADERPERRNDHFGPMALVALGDRWPC